MNLLIDAQLPPKLAAAFASTGIAASHVGSVGLLNAGDDEIWAFARLNGCAIVTKDEDFAARWARGDRAVPVVWIRIRNCSSAALIAQLAPRFAEIESLLAAGETLVELR